MKPGYNKGRGDLVKLIIVNPFTGEEHVYDCTKPYPPKQPKIKQPKIKKKKKEEEEDLENKEWNFIDINLDNLDNLDYSPDLDFLSLDLEKEEESIDLDNVDISFDNNLEEEEDHKIFS